MNIKNLWCIVHSALIKRNCSGRWKNYACPACMDNVFCQVEEAICWCGGADTWRVHSSTKTTFLYLSSARWRRRLFIHWAVIWSTCWRGGADTWRVPSSSNTTFVFVSWQVEAAVVHTLGRHLVHRLVIRSDSDDRAVPRRFCAEFVNLASMAAQHRTGIGEWMGIHW